MFNIFPFHNVNDLELFEVLNVGNCSSFSFLNYRVFNPFPHDECNAIDSALNDFHLNKLKCNYYFTDSDVWLRHRGNFNLMSFNISSIPRHFEALNDQCLDTLGIMLDVIGFCETRINDEISNLYSLSDYTAYLKNKNTSGGGVVIYIHNDFQGM